MVSVQTLDSSSRRRLGRVILGVLLAVSLWWPAMPAAAAPAPAPVATLTTVELSPAAVQYGDITVAVARVTPAGPASLMGQPVTFLLDGTPLSTGMLIYTGSGVFMALGVFTREIPAGTHVLTAQFDGYTPATGDSAAGSTSAPVSFTVRQAPSSTTLISAPSAATAFEAIDVSASVSSPVSGVAGTATLYGDNAPLATTNVAADGTVQFDDVIVPPGIGALHVGFDGDAAANFAPSSSAFFPITVSTIATSTALQLSDADTWAGDTVTATVDVRALSSAAPVTPRELHGTVEVLVNGSVVATAPVQPNGPTVFDGAHAQIALDTAALGLGAHTVSAQFLPMAGIDPSRSADAPLEVRPIVTTLTPDRGAVSGTPSLPVAVAVRVSEERGGEFPATGTVQPFVDGVSIGDPVALVDGAAEVTFAGLAVGAHDVELRFVPLASDRGESTAQVRVEIVADPVPAPAPAPAPAAPATALLATTGGEVPWLSLSAGLMLLAAGVVLSLRRRGAV